jgi:hypothetical protein
VGRSLLENAAIPQVVEDSRRYSSAVSSVGEHCCCWWWTVETLARRAGIVTTQRCMPSSSFRNCHMALEVQRHLQSQGGDRNTGRSHRHTTVVEDCRPLLTGTSPVQQRILENGSIARPFALPALVAAPVLLPSRLGGFSIRSCRCRRGRPCVIEEGPGLDIDEIHRDGAGGVQCRDWEWG